jgi:predicted phage terminase large subunit-like protein
MMCCGLPHAAATCPLRMAAPGMKDADWMSSALADDNEMRLRRDIRDSLSAWAHLVLAPRQQKPALHHLAIIDALEKVSSGETTRLLLLMPPGSAKSTYATLLFPAWWHARHPETAVITACHTASLAEHFGRGVRALLEEHAPRLQVKLREDARAAHRFLTAQGGEYFAIGVQGAVTGRRADLALIDDPVRCFADAESFSAREQLWNWFRSELVTRLKPDGRMVVAMTRWHMDDLAGRLIAQGGWATLRLPAIAETDDPLGRETGAALWPEWEGLPGLMDKRQMLGERAFAAMFQQAPQLEGGQLFDMRLIPLVDEVGVGPAVRAWDLAATAGGGGDPDWTVGLKLVRNRSCFIVDDVIRFRAVAGERDTRIRRCADVDGAQVIIGLAQDPGQAGKSQIGALTGMLAGYRVVSRRETGDKALRAAPVASQAHHGNLLVRRGVWNAAFLDELSCFPHGSKDDQVDALSLAFAFLTENTTPARYTTVPLFDR